MESKLAPTQAESQELPMAIGVVAIGRNEGERLRRCLASVVRPDCVVVYVDSGSQDGSVDMAREMGAEVIDLDLSIPFTAARARNEGWRHLLEHHPGLAAVQFLDGDCEMDGAWLEKAAHALQSQSTLAVVCGRRRERHPEATIYNRMCDIEWDTPIGPADSCGGDALFRVEALLAAGGYDDSAIAGEEPELCFRLRELGWKIQRLDAEMTLHDADMTRLKQWWQRHKRAGHAYASNRRRHAAAGFMQSQVHSALVWGFALPLVALLLSLVVSPWILLAYGIYPLQLMRIAMRFRRQQKAQPWSIALAYALHCLVGKFAEAAGVIGEGRRHRRGEVRLIEYK
jgi:GT2 family glycosyltransferase